jgi:hypothetical protein
MIALTFDERYRQARLYAAQVRTRKAMGERYDHARPWRAPGNRSLRAIELTEQNFKAIVSSQGA